MYPGSRLRTVQTSSSNPVHTVCTHFKWTLRLNEEKFYSFKQRKRNGEEKTITPI